MSIQLTVNHLKTPELATARTFDLARIQIGRDPSNHLVLPDRRNIVSKYHAEILCNGDFRLVDIGSTNRTFLNGQQLAPHHPAPLKPGDSIQIGDFEITFVLNAGSKQPSAMSGTAAPPQVDQTGHHHFNALTSAHSDDSAVTKEALRRAVKELMLLNDLSREISASLDSQAILTQIIRYSVRATQARQGLITMVGEAQNQMETLIRQIDDSERLFHVNQSLFAWMDEHKQPVRLDRTQGDTEVSTILWDTALRSVLCVPLLVRSRLIGILSVCNKHGVTGFTEEDERLLMIIAGQSAQVLETARLYEEEQRLHRMREEFRMAYDIQMDLLPKETPPVEGYDLAGRSIPAQTVGGDYFDFIPIDEQRLACCVADVSGKGLPAALVMANVQATIRAQALVQSSASASLNASNTLLYRSTGRSTFVTLCYGLLDTRTHRFRYANAGHNRPLLLRHQAPVRRLKVAGLVLGFQPSWTYQEEEVAVQPGDVLVIYSDGISEAMNAQHEEFGEERLVEVLHQHLHAPAEVLIDRVFQAVERHAGGYPQSDDMTLMLLKRTS